MTMAVEGHFYHLEWKQTASSPFKAIPTGHDGKEGEKKFPTKSNLIQIAFAPKEETSKPFRKNKLTVISFV